MTDFETLGGEQILRAVIDDFVECVFADIMIGFHFRNADPARIKKFEYQMAARMLGAKVVYEGKALQKAHAPHGIMGGQFMRRQVLLRDTLKSHNIDAGVIDRWLAHNEALRPLITGDAGSNCSHEEATKRVESFRALDNDSS
jgi:truncated hemoglobin YjbI